LQEEIVPCLRTTIPQAVRAVGCEDPEELVQDATAMAAKLLDRAEATGKTVTPGNIAYYTMQHMRSGRRSTGSSVVDVLQVATQLHGHTRLTSLEEPAAMDGESGGEIFTFHDVLMGGAEDPSVTAARRMDWTALYAQLSERERCVVLFVAEGKTLQDAADKFGLSNSMMQHVKRSVGRAIREFMGADILITVRRPPQWKAGIMALRERQACRDERRLL
jgi:hypothetical protein